MGIIEHLPEPPLPYFDADKVDAAAEAYAKLSTPDAVIGDMRWRFMENKSSWTSG